MIAILSSWRKLARLRRILQVRRVQSRICRILKFSKRLVIYSVAWRT